MVGSTFLGTDKIDPKYILERRYLYFALMVLRYRQLRLQFPFKDPDELLKCSVDEIHDRNVDHMSNVELRSAFQEALHPQVMEIFGTFRKVDERLGFDLDDDEKEEEASVLDDNPFSKIDWHPLQQILRDEEQHTLEEIWMLIRYDESEQEESPVTRRSLSFLRRKLGAVQSLLLFHGIPIQKAPPGDSETTTTTNGDSTLDDFYMDTSNMNKRSLDMARHYQTLNMCRSALIRQELGYSILSLKSTIPTGGGTGGAGRGTFVDGLAPTGSLVAFQPGEIWPKEHLLTTAPDVMEHFDDGDEDCQTTLRFDDYVLDSRKSPVTVLTREGSMNPWALGHMVNHPPSTILPNCQSLMLDYTERMQLRDLMRYVPNVYARPPTWQSRFFDAEPVDMHGMCLLARRDVKNEELMYDYRLQSEQTPEWYSPVRYGDEFLDREQVVFFRDDWQK
jgi:hypothetical protein